MKKNHNNSTFTLRGQLVAKIHMYVVTATFLILGYGDGLSPSA
jgi:hypothetical protein